MHKSLKDHMNGYLFSLLANILLGVAVFLCALLGRSLGIQGPALAISLVWPATGISLAGMLLLGYRAWPGVLLGNMTYNLLFFSATGLSPSTAHLGALAVSFGSLAQALSATYIMRGFSTAQYFKTVQDVFIFLLPASFGSCLISSAVGVFTLYFAGVIPSADLMMKWFTFWMGDAMGIYVITPLIVTWTLTKGSPPIQNMLSTGITIGAAFLLLTAISFYFYYPLLHLYVPLALWASYCFYMRGASLAIFAFAMSSISYAYLVQGFEGSSLFTLMTFLGVTVIASLILAAVVQERAAAWEWIQSKNISLENEVDIKGEMIQEAHSEIYKKRRLAALGSLSLTVIGKMRSPLQNILYSSNKAKQILGQLKDAVETEKKFAPLTQDLSKLTYEIATIQKLGSVIDRMIEVVNPESSMSKETSVQSVNIHTILNDTIGKLMLEAQNEDPDFPIIANREFDRSVKMVPLLVEDFVEALSQLITHCLQRLKLHYKSAPQGYRPSIEIITTAQHDKLEIVIRDNAPTLSQQELLSYIETKAPGLLKVRDVIEEIHRGELSLHTNGGAFLQFKIILPKEIL